MTEPMTMWLQARDDLQALWTGFEALSTLSTAVPSPEERRDAALAALALTGADIEALSAGALERLLPAYLPQVEETERTAALEAVGALLNCRFIPPASPITPLVNPATLRLELVFPLGIQALFLISVALAREDRASFPTRCARQVCTRVSFMRGQKRYCSKACQEAEKSARYRRHKYDSAPSSTLLGLKLGEQGQQDIGKESGTASLHRSCP